MAAPNIEELLALPEETRLEIFEALGASLGRDVPAADELHLTDEDRALLEERLRDVKAHPEDTIPWDVVRVELFAGK